VDVVPEDAPVSTTNTAGSHLAARRILYSAPVVSQADWVLVDSWDSWMPSTTTRREGLHRELLERFLDRIASSPKWRRVFAEDGVFVCQRVAPR
jgi:hypothetical protein